MKSKKTSSESPLTKSDLLKVKLKTKLEQKLRSQFKEASDDKINKLVTIQIKKLISAKAASPQTFKSIESNHQNNEEKDDDDHQDDSDDQKDDEEDEEEEDEQPKRPKRKLDDFGDIKEILAEEFGSRMEKQIKIIEEEEQQDADQHDQQQQLESKDVATNLRSTRGVESKQQFSELIDYIHSRCPSLEKPLIVELLKYDDNVVFVGNVPISMQSKQLKKLFRQFGNVTSVRIRGATGAKGFDKKLACIKPGQSNQTVNAYVVFDDVESADKAIKCNGQKLNEHSFRICKAYRYESKKFYNVVLRNLPHRAKFDMIQSMVSDFLKECGRVVRLKVFKEKPTDNHFSTGLIFFESADSVQLALLKNGSKLDKNVIKVEPYTESTRLGFKYLKTPPVTRPGQSGGKPVHKKKLLKKQLKQAKRNANKNQAHKVAYARKHKQHI